MHSPYKPLAYFFMMMTFFSVKRQREAERAAVEDAEHHDGDGHDEESGPASSVVGRTFRYMRRIPTIIEYKPPDHGIKLNSIQQQKSNSYFSPNLWSDNSKE